MTSIETSIETGAQMRDIATSEEAASRYWALPKERYDLIIIGGGSAGLTAATTAAALGASVALLDRSRLGGECLYTGCVPSKALLHVAHLVARIRSAAALGLDVQLSDIPFAAVAERVQRAIRDVYIESDAPEHYIARGIDVAFGEMRFISPSALSVNGQHVTARRFLLSTGSRPRIPAIPGLAEAAFLTNETVFDLRQLPKRLAVIGGGPIGCELGQAFARLGSNVTIFQRPERLIPKDEPEASALLRDCLAADGVAVWTRAEVTGVTRRGDERIIAVRATEGNAEVAVDAILVAVGRRPSTHGLDLVAAGVPVDDQRGVVVDRSLRTNNRRIFAAGDVIGGYRFTHAAALQARVAVRNALFPGRAKLDERVMPWATFTDPEVAHVGLTEAEARQRHGDRVRCVTQPFRAVDRAITDQETTGYVKLVATKDGKLLGAQMVGAGAGEHINELAVALQHRLTLADLAATTHVYPTLALAIQQAAGAYSLDRTARRLAVRVLRAVAGW